ncbi:branched-chain amino acid ABC transporter permease [Alicyclobacillaceae bacterium I2511]|nr:branched-chain amino acid ABC transporter permease [Alicyclobacillaceae bacterium I2511]
MRKRIVSNGIVIVLLALAFAIAPAFYSNESVLFQMMVFLALAQGVNILYGFTGYLPFGYVGFFGIGAYGASVSISLWHTPAWLAMIAGGIAALVAGGMLSPLLRLSGAYFAIGSLAASQVLYYVVSNSNLQNITNGPYGVNLAAVFNDRASYFAMLLVLIITTMFVAYLRMSRLGMSLVAVREDPISAGMAGIHVVRTRTFVWLTTAVIAGLVGAVYAWHISVFYPDTVFDLSISIFAIVFTLFGGGATVLGPIIGTVILYGVYNVIGVSDPQYFQLIYGVLIMVLVLFLPNGVLSLLRRRGIDVP